MRIASFILIALLLTPLIMGCSPERQSEKAAEREMERIYNRTKKYIFDRDDPPMTVQDLVENNYYDIDPVLFEQWDFEIHWPNEIVAISTEDNPAGTGKLLTFYIPEGGSD